MGFEDLDYLIAVRHGESGFGGRLTDDGVRQAEYAGALIDAFLDNNVPGWSGEDVAMVTSEALRAQETGKIVANLLGLEVLAHCSTVGDVGGEGSRDMDEIKDQLREFAQAMKVLIVVAHKPQVVFLGYNLGFINFNRVDRKREVGNGDIWIYDNEGNIIYLV